MEISQLVFSNKTMRDSFKEVRVVHESKRTHTLGLQQPEERTLAWCLVAKYAAYLRFGRILVIPELMCRCEILQCVSNSLQFACDIVYSSKAFQGFLRRQLGSRYPGLRP